MWIFPWTNFSWYSGIMWDNFWRLNWFWQFLSEGLSFFYMKWFCYSNAWSTSLCETKTSVYTRAFLWKIWWFLSVFSIDFIFIQFPISFFSIDHYHVLTVFDAVSSDIRKILSINPSANVLFFGDFNVHQKYWLICHDKIDRSGEFYYNSFISNDPFQIFNLPTWIRDCKWLPCSFRFIPNLFPAITFLILGNSDHIVVPVSADFVFI